MSADEEKALQYFGENIRLRRVIPNVSQEALAFRAGIHRTQMTLLETGRRNARITTLLKLCAGLDATPNDLLAGISWQLGGHTPGEFIVIDEEGRPTLRKGTRP